MHMITGGAVGHSLDYTSNGCGFESHYWPQPRDQRQETIQNNSAYSHFRPNT